MPELTTNDFPQADRIEQVGLVAEAVAAGRQSDISIEEFLGLGSLGRQGRYYRHTAELFGLITTDQNVSSLTELGQEFVTLQSANEKRRFLETCFAETALMRRIAPFVESKRPTEAELRAFVIDLYPGASSTGERRVSSVMQYLSGSRLFSPEGGRLRTDSIAGSAFIKRRSSERQLTGRSASSEVESDVIHSEGQIIKVEIDAAKRERANLTHRRLVAAAAFALRQREKTAQENQLIDLFCETDPPILYEVKSVMKGTLAIQVRRAVGQLYEYRYRHGAPSAKLCVVTNWQPEKGEEWVVNFLEEDRGMAYTWTNDFKTFFTSERSASILGGSVL